MSETKQMVLEILGGPLDGATITLKDDTEWQRTGKGSLTFPWDAELGQPQAHFTVTDDGWYLEGLEDAPHGTYRVNREEKVTGKKVQLERGDVLKASKIWLVIHRVERTAT